MKVWNRRWIWTLIFGVLFMVLSCVKIVVLPQGGSVTYLSLLFLWLITYFFGFRYGLIWSILLGFVRLGLNYLTGEFINYDPFALLLEYPLGFSVFALGGLLKEPKSDTSVGSLGRFRAEPFKLKMGYAIGVLGQLVLYVISAVCFYPPDREGFWNNLLFCILYDGSYLMVEGVMTLLFLCVPPVHEAIYYLKDIATCREEEDDTLRYF